MTDGSSHPSDIWHFVMKRRRLDALTLMCSHCCGQTTNHELRMSVLYLWPLGRWLHVKPLTVSFHVKLVSWKWNTNENTETQFFCGFPLETCKTTDLFRIQYQVPAGLVSQIPIWYWYHSYISYKRLNKQHLVVLRILGPPVVWKSAHKL